MTSLREQFIQSLGTGQIKALTDYLAGEIADMHRQLEGAPLAKVRHMQGQIAALRSMQELFRAGNGAQPAQRTGGYAA